MPILLSERERILKHKRVIRLFFNTFDETLAENVVREVTRYGTIRVQRSGVTRELYFVEIEPRPGEDHNQLAREIEEKLRNNDQLFGVKVYTVET